jgi:two-component system, response regulator YesN
VIKILVVEDDKLARKGLIHAIPWAKFDMEVVGEANNGETALEFLGSHEVDLMLTDLAMPTMSGLDLMRITRQRHPRLLSVVLTMHQEFEYLQESIRLGAIDYIAKVQLEKESFDEILERIRTRFLQERKRLDSIRTDGGEGESFSSEVACVLLSVDENADPDSLRLAFPDWHPAEIGNGAWLWMPDPGRSPDVADFAKAAAAQDGPMVLVLSGLTGERRDRVYHLIRNYHKRDFFYDYDGRDAVVERTLKDLDPSQPSEAEETIAAMAVEWSGFDWIYDEALYARLRTSLRQARLPVTRLYQLTAELRNEWNRVFGPIGGRKIGDPEVFRTWMEVEAWLTDIRESTWLMTMKSQYSKETVECVLRAVRIAEREMEKQVFAVDVARRVNLSRGYFCQVFKDVVGKSFNDYLRFIRIEKAKPLLLHSDAPIYRIAEQVGYTDEKYFSRMFSEATGLLPSAFRQHDRSGRRLS